MHRKCRGALLKYSNNAHNIVTGEIVQPTTRILPTGPSCNNERSPDAIPASPNANATFTLRCQGKLSSHAHSTASTSNSKSLQTLNSSSRKARDSLRSAKRPLSLLSTRPIEQPASCTSQRAYATSRKGKPQPINNERTTVIKKLTERTIVLTPWRGHPTLLHVLAFVQALERRFGRIWWTGTSSDTANPYVLRQFIIVVFESSSSLRKIPGFIFDLANTPQQQAITDTTLDGRSRKFAPTVEYNNMTPLFVPWSKKLDELSVRQGGPALEDVLGFLGTAHPTADANAAASATGDPDAEMLRASWDDFDEAVNIDGIVKKWGTKELFLLKVDEGTRPPPYLRPKERLSIANAFVDFGGFASEPVPAMKRLVEDWKEEVEMQRASRWKPYIDASAEEHEMDEPIDDRDMLFNKDTNIERDESEWDDDALPSSHQVVDENVQAELDRMKNEEHTYQPIGFSPLGVDEDLNAPHPLQFPASIRNAGPSGHSKNGKDKDAKEQPQKDPRQRRREDWDDWRSEPRPFRNGLGRDDPEMAGTLSMRIRNSNSTGREDGRDGEPTPTMRGSHSIKSSYWETDRRGKKLRGRSEVERDEPARHDFAERGRGQGSRGRVEKRWEEIFPKEEDEAQIKAREEERKIRDAQEAKERRLKERLRAILDGT